MSVEAENIAVVRRFYEEVFNQEAVLDEIISSEDMDYGHNPPRQGIEGAKADFRGEEVRLISVMLNFTINDLIATGDRVAVGWTETGDFMGVPASGKTVTLTLTGISLYRVANGKLLETRNAVNWLDLLQGLQQFGVKTTLRMRD